MTVSHPIRAATLCSGIGAPEVAMPGWDWVWCAEVEAFPAAVLAARHGRPNLGDITAPDFVAHAVKIGIPEVLIAGTPCQAFSVAGHRDGLNDDRGNLTLRGLDIYEELDRAARSSGAPPSPISGRTSPASSPTAPTPSDASSPDWWGMMPPSRRLPGEAGLTQVWFLGPRDVPRGVSSMLNTSDWPNDARVCSLSQVLQVGPIPPRFFLSARACAGILRRAEKRGKKLPATLDTALRQTAATMPPGDDPEDESGAPED
jgi:hypothetical protein